MRCIKIISHENGYVSVYTYSDQRSLQHAILPTGAPSMWLCSSKQTENEMNALVYGLVYSRFRVYLSFSNVQGKR